MLPEATNVSLWIRRVGRTGAHLGNGTMLATKRRTRGSCGDEICQGDLSSCLKAVAAHLGTTGTMAKGSVTGASLSARRRVSLVCRSSRRDPHDSQQTSPHCAAMMRFPMLKRSLERREQRLVVQERRRKQHVDLCTCTSTISHRISSECAQGTARTVSLKCAESFDETSLGARAGSMALSAHSSYSIRSIMRSPSTCVRPAVSNPIVTSSAPPHPARLPSLLAHSRMPCVSTCPRLPFRVQPTSLQPCRSPCACSGSRRADLDVSRRRWRFGATGARHGAGTAVGGLSTLAVTAGAPAASAGSGSRVASCR